MGSSKGDTYKGGGVNMEEKSVIPIGVKPEWLWIELRLDDLNDAIVRFLDVGIVIPTNWVRERELHIKDLAKRYPKQWRKFQEHGFHPVNIQI